MSDTAEALPRQTYKTDQDAIAEEIIAVEFAKWVQADQLKIGTDPFDKQKARVDRVFHRNGHVVAFAEIKNYPKYAYQQLPYWTLGRRKIETLRGLRDIVQVPIYVIMGFCDHTIAYFDACSTQFTPVEKFGRDDRDDPADIEPGARYQWAQFKTRKI